MNVVHSFHYFVGVSHFAECRENRPVCECMRNANRPKSPKIPYSAMAREVEKWSGIRVRNISPPEVNLFFRLIGPIIAPNFNEIGWLLGWFFLEVDLYSAFIVVPHTQGAQVRITQCYLQITPYSTCLYLVSLHQMAHPQTEVADI